MEGHLHVLVLVWLCMQCYAETGREQTFEINNLSPEDVKVNIRSEISGQITWYYTDDYNFILKVKIVGEGKDIINSTDISLVTTNSTVQFDVREKYVPLAPAPVTGTGNKLGIPVYFLWCLALLISWNNPMAVFIVVAVLAFTPGIADDTYTIPKKAVEIEIKAPRRFSYKTVDLYINGGKLRVEGSVPNRPQVIACKTEATAENGCPHCCHGNGACVESHCVCDADYDQETNCALRDTELIFFSHPLDPRFHRMVQPETSVLTVGRAFQFIQQPPYLKDPDVFAMEIRTSDITFTNILVVFHQDGFIEKIIDIGSTQNNAVKFKRLKFNPCIVRLKGRRINKEIKICDKDNNKKTPMYERTSKGFEYRRKSKRQRQREKPQDGYKYVDFPVRIHKCGYNSQDMKLVYFQLFEEHIDLPQGRDSLKGTQLFHSANENIILQSHEITDGTTVLRLPDNSKPMGSEELARKCEMTKSIQRKICLSSNLGNFSVVCNSISKQSDINQSTPSHISRIVQLCRFVIESVRSYCDNLISKVLSKDKNCLADDINKFNLFSKNSYNIRPIVVFPDDKTVYGQVRAVTFTNNTRLENDSKELSVIDGDANFKIVRISVIPTDPVPHDIYQVKLDYACATSQTDIKMTVYGSDFYSNSVTCRGTTHCNCCILHAAGAPNAVVDRVTINITDTSRNYKLIKEMVVVF